MRYIFILLAVLCTSCGTALPTIKPYKLDVQQGNVVNSKMLLQLRPGMTKSQVRFIMGTPLIQDSFHGNRWDYVYQLRENGKITEQRRVILDFENELLKSVRGDVVPSGSEKAKPSDGAASSGTRIVAPNDKPEEKSLMRKLKFWEKDETAVTAPASAAKGKAEADEAAKKTDTENAAVIQKNTAQPEESKSILAVPVEVLPALETPTQPVPVAPVGVPAVQEMPAGKAIESVPEQVIPPTYEPSAGMKFDKSLKSEEVEPTVKPEVVAPRAGNKTVPKPKDLPEENTPGFFEQMLEKIGF